MQYSCHLAAWPRMLPGLEEAARLGFAGCEAFATAVFGFEGREPRLAATLDGLGLRLSALDADLSLTDAGDARRAAELLERFDTDRLVVTARPAGAPRSAVVALLNDVAALARVAGGALCLHPHTRSAVETLGDLDAAMTATREVLVCVDTGHLARAGADPVAVIDRWPDRLGAVHLTDVRADGTVCELGRGTVDLPAVFGALDRAGYDGWVTLEIEGAADPAASLAACRDELVRLDRWTVAPRCGRGSG